MILVCPTCNSRYLVPATVFATGPRQVRCARCSHSWQADLPAVEIEAMSKLAAQDMAMAGKNTMMGGPFTEPPVEIPSIPPGSNVPAIRRDAFWRRGMTAFKKLSMRQTVIAGGGAFVAVMLLWMILDRQNIAMHAHWMEPIYDSVGLELAHVDDGLVLQQVHSERRYEDGSMRLVVEGEVHNTSLFQLEVPAIQAVALGSDGKEMRSWQIDAPAATLDGGAHAPFRSSVTTPEGTVTEINLSFVGLQHEHNE